MLRFENISLDLNGKRILRNVSFEIESGQSVLLVGNSGAGKSTILKLILGLLRPSHGYIFSMGREITNLSENSLMEIRRKCGIVFQGGALFDSLTVEDNVGFFLRENLRLPETEIKIRVRENLNYLGLGDFLHYYPSQLSGGMKKRVAIARAIVSDPSLLLYDEPTAGLDPVAAKRVVRLIGKLKTELDVTSIIVSHEAHYFTENVDRMIMLREGEIAYDGYPSLDIVQEQFFDVENELRFAS